MKSVTLMHVKYTGPSRGYSKDEDKTEPENRHTH